MFDRDYDGETLAHTETVHLVLNETPRKGKNKVTWVVYAATLGHPSTDDTRVIALACSWMPF